MTAINQISTSSPVAIVSGDELFINSGVNVVTTSVGSAAVTATGASGADIFNFGTIFAINQIGIDLGVPAGNIYNAGLIGSGSSSNLAIDLAKDYVEGLLTITNTETGVIAGQIEIRESGAVGSSPETGEVRLINNGEINVPGSISPTSTHYGAEIDGVFTIVVINTGTITADEGIYARTRGADDNVPIIRNSGIINARIYDGIDYDNGSPTTAGLIENSGTVSSVADNAIEASGLVTVRNTATGLIQGDVDMSGTFSGITELWNAGVIIGQVQTGTGENHVINKGTIEGDILLENEDDFYNGFGSGVVTGLLDAGFGDDTLMVEQNDLRIDGGEGFDVVYARSDVLDVTNVEQIVLEGNGNHAVAGSGDAEEIIGNFGRNYIEGGGGDDTIEGGAADDMLFGNDGSDQIDGGTGEDNIRGGTGGDEIFGGDGEDILRGEDGADDIRAGFGDDVLAGNDGNDTIRGGEDDDRLYGGGDDDVLAGNDGNDVLDGNVGDDTLFGGRGDDALLGGDGRDVLSGGTGADVFVFETVDHSPQGGATRVTITDFETSLDRIDLSGFAGTLTFVGAAYTGAGNEVRYNDSIGRLYIDVDGDSISDFAVDLTGAPAIDAGDLIL